MRKLSLREIRGLFQEHVTVGRFKYWQPGLQACFLDLYFLQLPNPKCMGLMISIIHMWKLRLREAK